MGSDTFDDGGGAHATTGAHGDQAGLQITTLEFVEQRADEDATRGTNGVTKSHRATIHIDLVPRHAGVFHELEYDSGECFVHLEQVDVIERHARLLHATF